MRPACGSGSFLIGAYQYLLDWHRDRYLDDRDYLYRYSDDYIYRVNRRTGIIEELISVLGL